MFDQKPNLKSESARTFTYALMAGIVGCTLLVGCKKTPIAQSSDPNAPDPAAANLAPVDPNQPQSYPPQGAYPAQRGVVSQTGPGAPRTRVLAQSQTGESYRQSESYGQQQPAPIERAPDPQNYTPPQSTGNGGYEAGDENFDQTIDQYAEEAPQPPPPLPVYEQPPAPEPNYLWTPGYWSYASTGYFWVPGAWCAPPYAGALWTPGYWGYEGNRYRFRRGFWGRHIGYYGGIAYGFGYTGHGYEGGYWRGNDFFYNRSVNRVNETVIHNTYVHNVTINNTVINNRISYNGPGGVQARPAAYEVAAMRERHTPPQAAQTQIRQQAAGDRQQFFNQNHGRPAVAVAQRPLVADRGVVAPPRQQVAQPGERPASGTLGQQAQPGQPQRFGDQPRPGQGQQEPPQQRTLNTPQHDRLQNGTVRVPAPNQTQERQFEHTQPVTPTQPQQTVRQDQGRRPNLPGEQQRGQTIPHPEQRAQPAQTPHTQSLPQTQQPRSQFGQPRDPQQSQQRTQPQIQPRVPQPQQQPQQQPQAQPQRSPQPQQQRPQPQMQQRTPSQPRVEPQQQRPQAQPGGQPRAEVPHAAPQGSSHPEHSPK